MREFTEYFDGVRRRTVGFFRTIPADMIDWAPKDGEDEVHHRSQLASYLRLMGVDAPDIFGLGVEDVARLSAADVGRI
jgi:hypothetical protein